MLDELSHWHKKRKSFTLMQGVVLCGSLEFWANTSTWVRLIYHQLRSAVNKCLQNCSKIAKNEKEIKELISDLANTKNLEDFSSKEKFIQKRIAKETYKCQHKAFIDKPMRKELNIMKNILSNPNQFNLEAPIAHVINRHPDFISYGDASLEAAGGFSRDLFWWHIEWPDQIKSLTLKKIIVTRKCLDTDKLVSINLLEFIVEIINYIAITQLYKEEPKLCSHFNPLLMN